MTDPKSSPKRGSQFALIALIVVLLAMSAFVLVKSRGNAGAAVNYDDPNMQKTNEFVNEATASCLQKEADAGSDIPSCINNYKGGPAETSPKTSTTPTEDFSTSPPAVQSTPN